VVLGAGGRVNADVDIEACHRAGVPLARRSSGGGTVLLGAGCLLYSLILRMDRASEMQSIPSSQAYILGVITAALNRRFPGTSMAGYGDIVLAVRKCGGSAQQRKRDHLLFHGTILYDFDLAAIGRFL